MFGHDSKPSKIYRYGCLAPTVNLEAALEQICFGHRYRNRLVEIEHARRGAVNETLARLCPKVARLTAAADAAAARLELARDAAKQSNVARRTRKNNPLADAVKAEIACLRETRRQLKAERRAAFASRRVRAALQAVEDATAETRRAARADSKLYWGNYLTVEQAAASFRTGPPPKYHRFTGEGRLAVQLQKGLAVPAATLCEDRRLRLELTGEVGRGRRPLGEAWFRIGSFDDRPAGGKKEAPVWCVLPFVYHRPLPPDAAVKWAYLHRRRTGTRWRWELSLVVSRDEEWPIPDAAATGRAAVRVGWKQTAEGLLVAAWAGDDGREGSLVIPADDAAGPARGLRRWSDAATLRAARDRTFNVARDSLAEWTAAAAAPEWFAEATATLRQWRSPARLAGLVHRWRAARFPGDDEAFTATEAWRVADAREWNMEAGQRARAGRWRDDLYRNFVAGLRRQYRRVVVSDVDYAELAVLPGPERDAEWVNAAANRNRVVAAPGRLRQLLREGFAECEEVADRPNRKAG